MRDLSFDAPGRLWVLAAVAVLAAAAAAWRWRQRRTQEPYAEAALLPSVAPRRLGWRRPVAAAGLALAVVTLTTAFARPSVVAADASERAVVVVALDTSSSMLATDVAPDRFTAAKAAAQAFIRDLPAQIDVGLVAYNASAKLVAAPTAVARGRRERPSTASRCPAAPPPATPCGSRSTRCSASCKTAAGEEQPAARIVLLADGASTTGTALEQAVSTVAAARVPVSTIAYGTPDGVVVANGVTYQVPVDLVALQQVADATGGTAYEAATAAQLRDVYDDIGTALVADTRREDVADVFAGLGLVLLAGTAVPSLLWTARLA